LRHISRSVTITFLMAGFLAHLVVPFSSQAQKTAFTRWLNHNVVASGNESEIELRNSIKQLPDQTGDFWGLVQEASKLVSKNKDHFKIQVNHSTEYNTREAQSWLVDQWNIFQNQKSGFNTVLNDRIKSISNWLPNNNLFSFLKQHSTENTHYYFSEKFVYSFENLPYLIRPLVNGISINAP